MRPVEVDSNHRQIFSLSLKAIGSLSLLFLFLIGFSSCKKDVEPLDIVPAIEILSISPAVVNEYTDEVVISISYTDGDGDLGENSASVKNCFVTDNRIGITSSYRIRQLSPDGSAIPIKGILDLKIGGQGITDGSSQQNVSFSLYVVDRAGHRSNVVNTASVTIRKP
jgi:hypothetical protein